MSNIMIGIIGIIVLLVLIFMGMNIGMALMTVGFVGYAMITNWTAAFSVLQTVPSTQASSYSMMVIPLFILMGDFAYRANLSSGLYDFAKKWLSRVPGNLACTTIVASAGFGAVCGSTPATCATMGTIALPEMRAEGYDDKLSTGAVCFGGTLGVLIPPSTPMILYAVLTTSSIGTLFCAGILPGIMMAVLGCLTVVVLCLTHKGYAPPTRSYTWKERFISSKGLIGVVILFGVVLGGMFSGWTSVSQAAAIGGFVGCILCIPGGTFNWKTIISTLKSTTQTFAMTFFMVIGAAVFGSFLTISTVPTALASAIGGNGGSKYLVLLLITLVYIFLGMIMDALPMMMLTVPIFYPIVTALGFSGIWFGIYIVLVMNFGSISPPVGMCCFVVNGLMKDVNLGTIYRGVIPYFVTMVVGIALLILIPSIATVLPQLMGLL